MFITRRNPFALFNQDEAPGAGQAPTEGTPDAGLDAGTQQQQEIDWQKRYGDLQPEYTRATQEAAQLRQRDQLYQQLLYADDQDTRRQAAQALGIELADDEPDDTQHDDPYEALRAELSQLREQFQGDRQQARQEQQIAALEVATENALNALKVPDDEATRDWIVARAVALPPNDQGLPDVAKAWSEFQGLINAQKKQWAETKRTHQFSPVGGEGTQTPNLDNRQERQDWMASRLLNDQ